MNGILIFLVILNNQGCIVCHSEIRKEYAESVHYKEKVSCTSCHGGNENTLDIKKAHGANFTGIPGRKKIVRMCAGCHSSPLKMKSYGISFDQEMVYYTSKHGESLRKGDENVAVCTDCHGVHKILPASHPLSTINPLNLPLTCGKCHSDFNLMKGYNISSDVVLEYTLSVHAGEVKKGNYKAPDCTGCHGTHGATPPGIGDIEKVCGKCHIRTRSFFLKSTHSKIWSKMGYMECEGCHNNHYVRKTSHELWKRACEKCHSRESKEYKIAEEIYTLFITCEMEIKKAEEFIGVLKQIPLEVEDFIGRLEEARTYLIEAEPVSHSLSIKEIKNLVTKSKSIAEGIEREAIRKKKLFENKRILLPIFWFFIFFTIALIIYMRR